MNYDILKFLGQVVLPALITCAVTIMTQLGYEYTETFSVIATAILTCYNAIIVYWNKQYYKEQSIEKAYEGEL